MKTTFALALNLAVANALAAAPEADAPAVVVSAALINQLAAQARLSNAALRASAERVVAAEQEARGVRVWEDPMVKLGGSVFSARGMDPAEQGDLLYGLEQKLPLFGKAAAARRLAEAGWATAELSAEYQFQRTRLEIARALFQAALADRLVEIGEQDLAWLERWTAVAEEKYRVGTASQVELLRLQNERARRANQLQTERNQRDAERALLNRQLGRPPDVRWPTLRLPEVAPPIPYDRRLTELALAGEARLKVLRQEVRQAEAAAQFTRKQRLPDVSLGLDGRQYSGDGRFREGMFSLSLNLPWFNDPKYTADRRRDEARLRAALLEAEDYEIEVMAEVRRLTLAIDAARREALLYRDDNLPRAQQALAAAQAAWLANRGSFTDIMEARRMALEARALQARALAEQWLAMSELVLCCGLADLEALLKLAAELNRNPSPSQTP